MDGQTRSPTFPITETVANHCIEVAESCTFLEDHCALTKCVEGTIEDDAVSFLPVTAGPPTLLVVVLHRLTEGVVDDKAHVWLVYAHTEGYGGYNNLHGDGRRG